MPVLGWGADLGDVANPCEGHLQSARNRGRGEGEDVDANAETFHGVLGVDPEALLFVDHEKTQVPERNVIGEKTMGPYDHVDLTGADTLNNLLLLFGGQEPGEDLHSDRVGGEPFGERLVMLLGEECCRAEDGHLATILHRFESGPDRNFGLAKPDIPEDEPVHRFVVLHVLLDLLDGLQLIEGLFEGKGEDSNSPCQGVSFS